MDSFEKWTAQLIDDTQSRLTEYRKSIKGGNAEYKSTFIRNNVCKVIVEATKMSATGASDLS
jgi:hypothetical protein